MRTCLITPLFAVLVASSAAQGEDASEQWSISESTDAFTDKKSVGLSASSDGVSSALTDTGVVFSCEGQAQIEVGVFWLVGTMDGGDGEAISVDWRVGNLASHKSNWTILMNDPVRSLAISSKADASLLAEEMLKLDSSGAFFKVRSDLAYAEFPIEGFSAPWREFVSKCRLLDG